MAQLKSTKVFGDLNVTGEINVSTKITVNGEEVWDTGNFNPNTKTNTSTQVIAGTGLSGGGTLAANRTLNVSYGTAAGTAAQGNDSRINNGQTAFGWGNHASAGYAKTKADVGLSGIPNTNASTANFLRGDGTWVTPPNTNTTYTEITTSEIDEGTGSTLRTISGRRMKYALDKKSDTGHTHTWAQVTGKPTNYPTTWASVAAKPIVQTTGTSTSNIMSQKAVTDRLTPIEDRLDELERNQGVIGYWLLG